MVIQDNILTTKCYICIGYQLRYSRLFIGQMTRTQGTKVHSHTFHWSNYIWVLMKYRITFASTRPFLDCPSLLEICWTSVLNSFLSTEIPFPVNIVIHACFVSSSHNQDLVYFYADFWEDKEDNSLGDIVNQTTLGTIVN